MGLPFKIRFVIYLFLPNILAVRFKFCRSAAPFCADNEGWTHTILLLPSGDYWIRTLSTGNEKSESVSFELMPKDGVESTASWSALFIGVFRWALQIDTNRFGSADSFPVSRFKATQSDPKWIFNTRAFPVNSFFRHESIRIRSKVKLGIAWCKSV